MADEAAEARGMAEGYALGFEDEGPRPTREAGSRGPQYSLRTTELAGGIGTERKHSYASAKGRDAAMWREQAAAGDVDSMLTLARIAKRDAETVGEAEHWFRAAVDQGNLEGMHRLGACPSNVVLPHQ
ncbi:hypothetical protein, partial [Streptomyces sp. NPDC046805]|uniref:hypothetical protein n=1 Tax=Streptomyces sp. NPDC046805 TaxID=3155134 RepID=UPI0033F5456D